MKKGLTQIAVVLDRSGSMDSVKQATIDGFNEFVRQQKLVPGECNLKVVQFDNEYEELYDGSLANAIVLNGSTYVPRGMTALFDAVGRTIDLVGTRLAARPENERPEKVIIAIITDGYENSSREYTQAKLADSIKRQREAYSWEFVFIGANQDAVLTASTFNIPATGALTYNANSNSVRSMSASLSNYTASYRSTGVAAFTDEDREEATQKQ